MNKISSELIQAKSEGRFLQAVYNLSRSNSKELEIEIVFLHNNKLMDMVSEFSLISKDLEPDLNLFLTYEIFGNALLYLDADVKSVMECIKSLSNQISINYILESFFNFCKAEPLRSKEALKIILNSPEDFSDFIAPCFMSGSSSDLIYYFTTIMSLSGHSNIEVRKKVIFSLGKIMYSDNISIIERAVNYLEIAVKAEEDDEIIGYIIESIFHIGLGRYFLESKVSSVINSAFSKGRFFSMHSASNLFAFHFKDVPDLILELFVNYLVNVSRESKGSIENIEIGIIRLFENNKSENAINFLENFLILNREWFSIKMWDSLTYTLRCKKFKHILNKVITRWFLKGDSVLCQAVKDIIESKHIEDIHLELCSSELKGKDDKITFLGRKTIGYLYSHPIVVMDIFIYLISYCKDKDAICKNLMDNLFDPLLISYPIRTKKYLINLPKSKSRKMTSRIKNVLDRLNNYIEQRSIEKIPELLPSQSHRESHWRHFNQVVSLTLKSNREANPLFSRIKQTHIIYGKKSIQYIYGINKKASRIEIPMEHVFTEVELPQLYHIDPCGIRYKLQIFRAERWIREINN